jgi:phosphoglycolate phosphatase-like HAD superfamily hydrolase
LSRQRGETQAATESAVNAARAELARANGGIMTSLGNAMAAMGVDIATSVAWRKRLIDPARFLRVDPSLRTALGMLRDGSIHAHGPTGARQLVAVTNNPRSVGEATLGALGVLDLFLRVVGLDDTMKSKPASEPYLFAAQAAGAPTETCVSVGDRYDVDLAVPLALGMGAILVAGAEDVYLLPGLLANGS